MAADDTGFGDIMASVCINMAPDESPKPVEQRASTPQRPGFWQMFLAREERRILDEWSVEGQIKQ